jgi:hypothetical protein
MPERYITRSAQSATKRTEAATLHMTYPADSIDVRLHSPQPGTVIVWICGCVDRHTVGTLCEQVGRQFERAADVVLDLCHADLEPDVMDTLRRLGKEASEVDVVFRLAAEGACRDALLESGAPASQIYPSASASIACLPRTPAAFA